MPRGSSSPGDNKKPKKEKMNNNHKVPKGSVLVYEKQLKDGVIRLYRTQDGRLILVS